MTRSRVIAAAAAPLLVAGCADRGIASGPAASTGAGTWAAVTVAVAAAVIVLAALLVVPARPRGGSAFAAGLLAIQAGGVVVGAAVLVGAAVRSEQLLGRSVGSEQASSLLSLTHLDGGDAGFFRMMVATTVVLGGLLALVLVLAARFAAGGQPLECALACCVLGVEALAAGTVAVLGMLDYHSIPLPLTVAASGPIVLAIIRCWPRRAVTHQAEVSQLGYNDNHG